MKKSSQVVGLPLMGVKEGTADGSAIDFMIDASTKKVCYIILQGSNGYFGNSALPVREVMGVGNDYIITSTLGNVKELTQLKELKESGFFILGTRVISCTGDALGAVADFSFDEKEGTIETIELDNDTVIAGDKIISFSGDLVFVDEAGSVDIPAEPVEETPVEPTAFETEQREFLLGRTVVTDVTAEDGTVLAAAGTVLTEEIISKVDEAGKTLDLTLSVE